jgi:hypothetical protein
MRSLLAAILLLTLPAQAETPRSRETPREFMRTHPCPANGHTSGACPGYVRDHIVPLCKNGPDTVANMQWQTTAEGHAKDRWECRR